MDIEAERPMAFHSELKEELMVRHFVGFEKLGECFEYAVTLYSKNNKLELEKLLGTHATVEVRMDLPEPRYFDGIVCEFSHIGKQETYEVYRVILRPWFWLLSRWRGCEVFQYMSVLDIARDMFGKGTSSKPSSQDRAKKRSAFALFDDQRVLVQPPPREYCVQYRESDFDFVNRLLEQAGIYYYFKHELGKHTLVLADSILSHDTPAGFEVIQYGALADADRPEVGQFLEWSTTKQMAVGSVQLRDFDFTKSRAKLEVTKASAKEHELSDAAIYDFPGCYSEEDPGGRCAAIRLEEGQAGHELVRGVTDSRGLSAGSLFMLDGHTREDQNREYLVASIRYDMDAGSFHSGGAAAPSITSYITALPSQVQYRPPRNTPIPFVAGPQSARVVGPSGAVFCTDVYGRVKIQFPWDKDGKHDENSSCFVRVSQAWAGAEWGALHIPRIGQEVIVEFLDGDLDRPIVTGRVYNNVTKPPYDPRDRASQSGFKSQTVGGTADQYNEFRFEDRKDKEEILMRAQRDLTTRVRHDSQTTIGHDHKHTVKNNLNLKVSEGEYTTEVEKGRMYVHVPDAEFHVVSKLITEDAADSIELLVHGCRLFIDKTKLELTASGNTITLGPDGITIKGTMVRIN